MMKLTLTNNQNHAVPLMSDQGDGFAVELPPSEAYEFDGPYTVAVIGNKPSVTEQIKTGVAVIAETVKRIVAAWQGHNNSTTSHEGAAVNVTIINNGEKAIRVVLGDGTKDATVPGQGERYEATAWGYVELRELGDVATDPNQHEAA
jgi:hypothetical protein